MSKAIVVYDTVYGNTEGVAQAIGKGIDGAKVVKVSEISPADVSDIELLVVGAPTQKFRATTRIIDFIKLLPNETTSKLKVAAFDTRMDLKAIKSKVFRFIVKKGGFAAKPIDRLLRRKGAKSIADPEGFKVSGHEGPLKEGELERATEWGKKLQA
jgi:flavodoxin